MKKNLLICSLLLTQVFPLSASALDKFVSTSGQCQNNVTPDRVSLTLTVQATNKSANKAAGIVMQGYEKLRVAVKKLNLKDLQLQTAQYTVNPDWRYENNKQQLQGYIARMSLKIETSETQQISKLLELSAEHEVQEVGSPLPFLSNELQSKEYEACLSIAVKNARAKAEILATAAGSKIADVISIEETKEAVSTAMTSTRFDKSAESSVGIEIKPETITVTVYGKFSLK